MTVHTLYGTPMSSYTGEARSHLIENGLSYREVQSRGLAPTKAPLYSDFTHPNQRWSIS